MTSANLEADARFTSRNGHWIRRVVQTRERDQIAFGTIGRARCEVATDCCQGAVPGNMGNRLARWCSAKHKNNSAEGKVHDSAKEKPC